MKIVVRALTIVTLLFLTHACGFQLRGALSLSQDMAPLYFQKNSVFELGRGISALLASNKIQTTDNIEQAKAQLTLLNEAKTRRVLSVDSNGRVREYLLNYRVNFSITINSSENINAQSKDDSISISRSLLFDPDAVIAVANESDVLYKDMQRDAARLILLKLQASSRQNESKKQKSNSLKSNSQNEGQPQ